MKSSPYEPGPVLVSVESGLALARALHAAAVELAPNFGYGARPVSWEALPARQREALVAAAELALRRLAMQVEACRGGAIHSLIPRSRRWPDGRV